MLLYVRSVPMQIRITRILQVIAYGNYSVPESFMNCTAEVIMKIFIVQSVVYHDSIAKF